MKTINLRSSAQSIVLSVRSLIPPAVASVLILAALLLIPRTSQAGTNTWTGSGPFATGEGTRQITFIAIDPAHPHIIYAGTGSGTVFEYSATFEVSATAGTNGTIDGSYNAFPQTVNQGSTTGFRFIANEGYYISSVSGCGINYTPSSGEGLSVYTQTTGPIYGDCSAAANFLSVIGNFSVRRIYSGGSYEYGNVIMNAYNTPANNATSFGIELTASGQFGGENALVFNQNYAVKLGGGLKDDFGANPGGMSAIPGSLTIENGQCTVDGIEVGAAP